MDDLPRCMFVGVDIPNFFEADAVMLRVRMLIETKFSDKLLAQMASATLGEDGVLGM